MKSDSARLGRPGLARHLLAQRVQGRDGEFPRLVAIDENIVDCRRRDWRARSRSRRGPSAICSSTIFFSIACASAIQIARRLADLVVVQDGGKRPGQFPGLEERRPVDIVRQLRQIVIVVDARAEEFRRRRRIVREIQLGAVGARLARVSRLPPLRWLAWLRGHRLHIRRGCRRHNWRRCPC